MAPRLLPALAPLADGRVFVYGGTDPPMLDSGYRNDSAMVSLDLSATTPLPSPPTDPLRAATAVSADRKVVLAGIGCQSVEVLDGIGGPCSPGQLAVAILDIDSAQWATVELPSELARIDESPGGAERGWAYSRILGSLGDGQVLLELGDVSGEYWILDLRTLGWSTVAPPPVAPNDAPRAGGFGGSVIDSCLAGDTLIVVESGQPLDARTGGTGAVDAIVHAWGVKEQTWRTAAKLAHTFKNAPTLSCQASSAILTDGAGLVFGAWQIDVSSLKLSSLPLPPGDPKPYLFRLWTGYEVFFIPGSSGEPGLAFSPADSTWRETAPSPLPPGTIVTVGGTVFGFSDLAGDERTQATPYSYAP